MNYLISVIMYGTVFSAIVPEFPIFHEKNGQEIEICNQIFITNSVIALENIKSLDL